MFDPKTSEAKLSSSADAIKEGDTLTTTVDTKNVQPGTTLFWSLSGRGIDSKDLDKGSLSGSGVVSKNGSFSFSHLFQEDLTTEGDEKLIISLFSDKSLKNSIAETAIAIIDSSSENVKTPTYALTTSADSIKEGDTLTTTVDTKNVQPGTTLFWSLSGRGIDSKDLDKGSLSGSGVVSKNGSFSFSHLFQEDLTTEGDEKLIISLFSDKSLKNSIAETAIAIIDSSSENVKTPTYALTTSADSIKEGDTLTTTVDTKNVQPGTTLFWSLSGRGIDSKDLDKGSLSGSGVVSKNGSFSFSHLFQEDLTTEGDEKLIISLFSDKSLKNSIAETAIAIIDSSSENVKTPTYALTTSADSIKEGDTLTTTVDTKNVQPGTTLFWSLSGRGIDSKDLDKGSLSGSGVVSKNGSFSFSHLFQEDLTTEGDEKLIISLFSDKSLKNSIAETAIAIIDSSSENVKTPTYALTTSADSIKEGDTLTTTVDTKNVQPGTTLFWSLSGRDIDSKDLDKGSLSGSGVVSKNGSFSFSHLFQEDLTTEGDEKLIISLFSDKSLKNSIAETAIAIIDSSSENVKTPTYALTTSADSIKEGDTLTTTVDTKNVQPGTTLFWSLSGNGITSTDFDKGVLKGSGIVATDGSFSFSHTISNDNNQEGVEPFTIGLFTDSTLTNGVAKTAVGIADGSSGINIKSRNLIQEGQVLISKGKAPNLKGNTIFLASQGTNITKSDFANKTHIVKTKVAANGSFKVKQFIAKDLLTEGNETFVLEAFKDSKLTQPAGGTSNPISIADTSKQTSYPGNWSTIGKNSVFHRGFNVLTPGPVTIIVDGQVGQSVEASLYGSSNYSKGKIKPIARQLNPTGNTEFTFNVTAQHLKQGNNYRLGIAGGPQNNKGTYEIRLPEQRALLNKFNKQRVRLGTGDVWRTVKEQQDFYSDLLATSNGLSSVLGTRISCIDTHKFKLYDVQELGCLGSRTKTGLLTPGDAETVTDNGFKNYLYPLPPELKINQDILAGNFKGFEVTEGTGATKNLALNKNGNYLITIQTSSPDTTASAIKSIKKLGYKPRKLTPDTIDILGKGVKPMDLLKIAKIESILHISEGEDIGLPENASERNIHNANIHTEDWDGNGILNGNEDMDGDNRLDTNLDVAGRGIIVGVHDNDVRSHPDLTFSRNVGSTSATGNDHGTSVAGIIAASGRDGLNGSPVDASKSERGHAPAAQIHDKTGSSYTASEINAIDSGLVNIFNRSQTVDRNGRYSTSGSRTSDQIINGEAGNHRIPYALSAGNGGLTMNNNNHQWGFFAPSKQSKNGIIVGNLSTSTDLNDGSSLGPFYDGRIAPTLSADGTNVVTSSYTGGTFSYFSSGSGTSYASPAVAGTGALMLEAYRDLYLEQYGLNLASQAPLPSLIKAALVNTADDINADQKASEELIDDSGTNGQTEVATIGPDYLTGFGRLNTQAAVELIQQRRADDDGLNRPTGFIQGEIGDSQFTDYEFIIDQEWIDSRPDDQALKITMAWDDPASDAFNPSSGLAGNQQIQGPNEEDVNRLLINDLDIELIDPNGTVHYPWQLGHTITNMTGVEMSPSQQAIGLNNILGADYKINIPVLPVTNPSDPAADGASGDIGGTDYELINVNVFNGDNGVDEDNDGAWVAQHGRDRLNNIEQVAIQKADLSEGRWTIRVSGFDVPEAAQAYAVAGMPDPDLPDLKVEPLTRIALDENGGLHDFSWQALNLGDENAPASDYKIYLSEDITVDAGDVELTDINNLAQNLPAINVGNNSGQIDSKVNITNVHASSLLGGGSTVSDLIDEDTFLLVQADPDDNILEYAEQNTAAMQVARQIDVVLVLDRSGSMDNTVTASNGRSKMELMQESANLFLDMLRVDANDRFAGIEFNRNANILFPTTNNSLVPVNTTKVLSAQGEVDDLSSSGATDIHEALEDAHSLLTDGGNNRPKTIVFLSDGVSTAGQDPTDILPDLTSDDVKVFSVGFGNNGSNDIDVDLLSQLADQTDGGFWQYAQSGLALDKFFVNAVAGATGDDVIIDPVGELKKGKSTSVDVPLSSASGTVRFILTTDEELASKTLDFSIQTPSGLSIDSGNANSFDGINYIPGGPGYQVYEVELPLKGIAEEDQSGDWEMVINNPASTNKTIGYTASVIGQTQLHLSLDAAAQPSVVQSNQPLIAGLKLHSNGEDISFMEASVTIKGFQKNLEQVVQQATGFSSIKDYVDNKGAHLRKEENANNGELRTDANIADHLLSKDHPKVYKALRTFKDLQTIDLTSDSQRIKGVTRFSQPLKNLDLNPGPIELVYTVNGRLDDCTPFTRELTHSVFLKPKNYRRPEILQPGDDKGTHDVVIPDFDGDVITSQPGTVTLEGTNSNDAFIFDNSNELGAGGADTITNFNRRKDLLAFDSEVFPDLGNSKGKVRIKRTKRTNKKFDQLMKSKTDFVFVKNTGELYYNDNGNKNGAGEDGGLVAILDGTKSINASNFELF